MRVYHFTEQPYPNAWEKHEGSLRVNLPNRHLDPRIAADLFHAALDVDPKEYGLKVFRITSEISRQVFPLEIDIDNPKFVELLDKLIVISEKAGVQQAKGGMTAKISKFTTGLKAGWVFLRLYTMPTKRNELPANIRLAPGY